MNAGEFKEKKLEKIVDGASAGSSPFDVGFCPVILILIFQEITFAATNKGLSGQ